MPKVGSRGTAEERFWKKVRVYPTGCWPWIGCVDKKGYGHFRPIKSKQVLAHRFSFELKNGYVKDDAFILHSCDTPNCVNPDHLKIGTNKDNMIDASKKGRLYTRSAGWRNPKVSQDQVIQIRKLHESGLTQKSIAQRFGINQSNVSRIVNSVTFKNW